MALLLNEADVAACLTVSETIEVLRRAFAAPTELLPRWRGRGPGGVLNVMAAALPGLGYSGIKAYAVARGRPVRFHVLLYRCDTGDLEAIMAADQLGCIRTGAASGLATDLMARPDARVLACIGAGKQAWTQIEAVAAVRPPTEVRVYARRFPEDFCRQVGEKLGLDVRPCRTAQEAVSGADIVCTITNAAEPVLLGEWLEPGMHVNAAGSNRADHRELDEAAVRRAGRIVVDARATAVNECGDLLGVPGFDWDGVADLADVVQGKAPGRSAPGEITLFESQGLALEDVAAAAKALANARARGLGRQAGLD